MQVHDVKVIGYCRVSTDEQAEEGYSIRAQIDRIRAYAVAKGWVITDDDFFIDEGYSGKDLNRPAIQRLLQLTRQGEIDAVIVNRTDRLSRDLGDTVTITKQLKQSGISLISLSEDMKTDTATDRLKLNVTAVFNQYEREKRAEDVKMGMERAVKEGHRQGGTPPFGYDSMNQKLVINVEEAEVVRDIFDKYINGWGVRTICNYLNTSGIATKKGAKWTQKSLMYLVQNPVYIGKLRWNYRLPSGKRTFQEHIYDGGHDPIISEQLFLSAQETVQKRKEMAPRQSTNIHPFSGMIECGQCGRKLLIKHGALHWPYLHYVCPTKGCVRQIRHEDLVGQFLRQLGLLASDEFWEQEIAYSLNQNYHANELERLEKELAHINEKKQKWLLAYENDAVTITDLKERLNSMEGRQQELQARLVEWENKHAPKITIPRSELLAILNDFPALWDEATDKERKLMVHTLIKKIVYYPDRSIAIIPFS